jgi:hypothetical protein
MVPGLICMVADMVVKAGGNTNRISELADRDVSPGQIRRRVEDRCAVGAGTEHAVRHQDVKMHVAVEIAAEPVHEGDGAEAGSGRRARAALADGRLDRAQDGHRSRPLQENATMKSCRQLAQQTRANP